MAQAYMTEPGQGQGPERVGSRAGRLRNWWRPEGMWRRGIVLAVLAVLLGLLMILHARIPNSVGNLGSLLETFLPWLGLCVPLLLIAAVLRRSTTALIALVLPVFAWFNLFGGQITDKAGCRMATSPSSPTTSMPTTPTRRPPPRTSWRPAPMWWRWRS